MDIMLHSLLNLDLQKAFDYLLVAYVNFSPQFLDNAVKAWKYIYGYDKKLGNSTV